MHQAIAQILLFYQFFLPLIGVPLQLREDVQPPLPQRWGDAAFTVPRQEKLFHSFRFRFGQVVAVKVEKGGQLCLVGFFFLRIDLPEHWLGCPLGPDEGIFATHEVEVAQPQQWVVRGLGNERDEV